MSSKRPTDLFLYSTSACHLCEQAELLLSKTLDPAVFTLCKVDISLDDALVEQYGTTIPVLAKAGKNGGQDELFWPFDKNKIQHFLSSNN